MGKGKSGFAVLTPSPRRSKFSRPSKGLELDLLSKFFFVHPLSFASKIEENNIQIQIVNEEETVNVALQANQSEPITETPVEKREMEETVGTNEVKEQPKEEIEETTKVETKEDGEVQTFVPEQDDEDYFEQFFEPEVVEPESVKLDGERGDLEEQFWNAKRGEKIMRNKCKNKKEKFSSTHYHVNGHRYYKQLSNEAYMAKHFANQKLAPQSGLCVGSPYNYRAPNNNNNNNNNNNVDADLQRALLISAREFTAASSVTGLTERQLRDLQSRELTPEDYELLLALDASVKPKTVEEKKVKNFTTATLTESNKMEGSCAVCLCDFEVGDTIKTLPCKHTFHANCIETWLTKSSVNCPVDGLPVC